MNTTALSSPHIAAINLRPFNPSDEFFSFQLYASTRADEIALFGWPADVEEDFVLKSEDKLYLETEWIPEKI